MKHMLMLCTALLVIAGTYAQHGISFSIKSKRENSALPAATVIISSLNKTVVADSNGIARFMGVPAGSYQIMVSYTGMKETQLQIAVPSAADTIEVLLEHAEEENEEVIVTSTRISRTIRDIPTRVEIISGEELTEKGNMKPGDIRMLLNESTGIQTQQTSATSYNSSIRIQGLDGRYTQILRDGFPLYAGFSGGLSLMQVAPLDLKQIEVIKGSSSTLYGGGAIAGLVNLISKTPSDKRELSFLANATSAGGWDISSFYSQKFKHLGVTLFGSSNTNKAYDPAGIGLTAIPQFERYTVNPRLFFYSDKTNADIGFSYISENRVGGSMDYIDKGAAGYFERNRTDRFAMQTQLTHLLNDYSQFNLKASYNHYHRSIEIPTGNFKGLQQSVFTEASYSIYHNSMQWITGINFLSDGFSEASHSATGLRDYHYNNTGLFIQNTWTASSKIAVEAGLRGDYVKPFGWELLPRASVMFRFSPRFTARIGGGLGYKTPTIFTEETEKIHFENVLPVAENIAVNERSAGANLDLNYRFRAGGFTFAFNQLFFYTKLNRPLILETIGTDYRLVNANGHIDTRGTETNIRISYSEWKLFAGYTFADVNTHFNNIKAWYPLTSRHRLNNVLMYEREGKLKIGAEAYYYSPQKLNDGSLTRSYWIIGLMGEKYWKHFSVFINFENIGDMRQTRFDSIYTGSVSNPVFRDIYAPVDGFVVNGGVKIMYF